MKKKQSSKAFAKKQRSALKPDRIMTTIRAAVLKDLRGGINESSADPRYLRKLYEAMSTSLDKKYINCDSAASATRDTALIKFLNVNLHMKEFTLERLDLPSTQDYQHSFLHKRLSPFKWCEDGRDRRHWILLTAKRIVYEILGTLDEDEWFSNCRLSAGASVGVPAWDTSPERKFQYPLSTTEKVLPLWNRYLAYDQRLASAIQEMNGISEINNLSIYQVVGESRVTTVEKTNQIDRVIAVEPTLNMFFQLGLMQTMYDRLEKVGLDVTSLPETHKALAYESSISGKYATIDWSSASDTVSSHLVEWLLPPQWWAAANLVRTGAVDLDGTRINCSMFATMGNGTTFPLETLILYSLLIATDRARKCAEAADSSYVAYVNYIDKTEFSDFVGSVFGDDCICLSDTAKPFMSIAESVGFIANWDKSFIVPEDRFRESCGGDYLSGRDVRPVYIKAPTSTAPRAVEAWLYKTYNQLTQKYMKYFGADEYIYDKAMFRCFARIFKECNISVKIVAPWLPEDAGIYTYGDLCRLKRYRFPLCRIGTDKHGSLDCSFLKFVYKQKREQCDHLRLALWLKNPYAIAREQHDVRLWKLRKRIEAIPQLRKYGSYIVTRQTLNFKP